MAGGRARRRRATVVAVLSACAALAGGGAAHAADPVYVEANLAPHAHPIPVPPSLVGLSIEYFGLEDDVILGGRRFENVLRLLRPHDGTPLLLRVGGESTDNVWWSGNGGVRPEWAIPRAITPKWLARAARLVKDVPLRVTLGLNFAARDPAYAAAWAQAARAGLPAGSIRAFEIGNEPDLYRMIPWYRTRDSPRAVRPRFHFSRSRTYSYADYAREIGPFVAALTPVVGDTPLAGPAVAGQAWLSQLGPFRRAVGSRISVITGHRYPLHFCGRKTDDPEYPTITRLLKDEASYGMAAALRPTLREVHGDGMTFELSEFGSVSCGGPKIAGSFGSALWAPDALFELATAGVDAVSFHTRPRRPNQPFGITPKGVFARPVFYGMLLFQRAFGTGAHILPIQVRRDANVKVWVTGAADGFMRVVVVNKTARPADVGLALPGRGPASVERLLTPGFHGHSKVTLAGQRVGLDGLMHGQFKIESVAPGPDGGYFVTLPPESAALVTIKQPPEFSPPGGLPLPLPQP